MTTNQAIKRFHWRLSSGKPFQPNQNDLEAYNTIAEFVEEKQKKEIVDNQLFGKLYIYLFGEFVNYYNTSAMDTIPQNELNRILAKDMRLLVDEVKDRMNINELEVVLKEKGDLKCYEGMSYDEVAENLRVMINGAINEYSPKKFQRV